MTEPTLIMRFADVGTVTYASLRVVGDPARTVTWVLEFARIREGLDDLAAALPEPLVGESVSEALARALTTGAYAAPDTEAALARRLGAALLPQPAWLLICAETQCRAVLFVSPSARVGRVPWGLLAVAAEGDDRRLVEVVDLLVAVPPNIVNAPRARTAWAARRGRPALAVLDPRVPGQRPDSALGSVLGRPSPESSLARHFADRVASRHLLPAVTTPVELFRRTDADRDWLATMLAESPSRLLYVGHASAAEDRSGRADQASLHLAEEHPLTAAAIMSRKTPMPPRVALIACASGGDYRFDEATGLVAAMIVCGAQLVTATLWSLPTTAGYRRFGGGSTDPMGELVVAVDDAHGADHAGRAVNDWQRECLRRWRGGETAVHPVYWAALVTFAVDGAR